MATKKSAAITKAAKVDDLTAAGIDVKLSKMEIADYIAAKAQEELELRKDELQKRYQEFSSGLSVTLDDLTDDQRTVVELYIKMHKAEIRDMSFNHWGEWRLSVRTNNRCGDLQLPLSDDQLNSDKIKEFTDTSNEIGEVNQRLHQLSKKSHRTMLIEKILGGSESGKKVLGDLTSMVKRAVHG